MIIEGIINDRKNLFWTFMHIGLGILCTLTPFALIGWFYFILITNISKAVTLLKNGTPAFFILLFSYLVSFEVLDRMAKTSPFIPYEMGKYLLVLMGLLGVLTLGVRAQKGIWMAILVTPAIFYDFSGQRVFYDLINYYLAPLAVGLGVAFADRLSISKNQLNQILKLVWLGCLSSLVFTYVKTPELDDIAFDLKANFDTTGGHSSNQVSTILGLGMFLSFYSVFNKLKFSGNRALDIIILAGFTFQGLLSFSRGGMLVGSLAILILIFLPDSKRQTLYAIPSKKPIILALFSLLMLYGIFNATNNITGGNLLLRYQGETQGTLLGSKERNLNQFSSGRIDIFQKDLALWGEYFLTGVGCGVSRYLRDSSNYAVAAHIELSRLLADHGILGLAFSIIFFSIPYQKWRINKNESQRTILFILLIFAIITTFHAAMRTFVTPLFMIIGSLKISEPIITNKNLNAKVI